MKKKVALAALVALVALAAAPAFAAEWTGKVKDIYLESMVFVVEQGDLETELWMGPEPPEFLLSAFKQLQVGDTVKVSFNEEEAIVLTLEVLQRAEPGEALPSVREPLEKKKLQDSPAH